MTIPRIYEPDGLVRAEYQDGAGNWHHVKPIDSGNWTPGTSTPAVTVRADADLDPRITTPERPPGVVTFDTTPWQRTFGWQRILEHARRDLPITLRGWFGAYQEFAEGSADSMLALADGVEGLAVVTSSGSAGLNFSRITYSPNHVLVIANNGYVIDEVLTASTARLCLLGPIGTGTGDTPWETDAVRQQRDADGADVTDIDEVPATESWRLVQAQPREVYNGTIGRLPGWAVASDRSTSAQLIVNLTVLPEEELYVGT